MTSKIEEQVEKLKQLRSEYQTLDSGICQMRLGAKHEYRYKRIWWRAMVYGFGWAENRGEPMAEGIESKFHLFLYQEMTRVGREIHNLEEALRNVDAK